MTRVLIVGGGVAGPVAAMALQRAGIDAVVYEARTPTSKLEGHANCEGQVGEVGGSAAGRPG